MPDLSRFRPVLWAAIGVCLLAGVIAVPVVADDDGSNVQAGEWVDSVGSPTSTSVAEGTAAPDAGVGGEPSAGDGVAGGGPAGTAAPGGGDAPAPGARPAGGAAPPGPSPTNAPPPGEGTASTSPPTTAAPTEDLGPPSDPGPATVPRAGLYRYKASDSRGERDTSTKIEDRPTTAPERRQLVTIRGDGFDTDNEVAWRGDGVYVLSTIITFGDNKGTCDWEPDTLQLKLPIVKGGSWESSSSCQMTGIGATPIPLNRKLTGKFLEIRRVRVAGQVVDVWAIEATEHLDGGGQVMDRAGTTLFSPKHGVVVSSSGKVTTSRGTSDYRTEIQNLTPE